LRFSLSLRNVEEMMAERGHYGFDKRRWAVHKFFG
jgi:transposase-like protein